MQLQYIPYVNAHVRQSAQVVSGLRTRQMHELYGLMIGHILILLLEESNLCFAVVCR